MGIREEKERRSERGGTEVRGRKDRGRGNRRGRYGRGWKGEEEEESGGRDFANHRPQL